MQHVQNPHLHSPHSTLHWQASAAALKPAALGNKSGKGGSQLVVGPFSMDPIEGVVPPGSKAEVTLTFKAEGAQASRWVIGPDPDLYTTMFALALFKKGWWWWW